MFPSPITGGEARGGATSYPFGHHHRPPPSPKTMEQVWREINLNELGDPGASSSAAAAGPPPRPATVLSLNCGPEFYFPCTDDRHDDGEFDALASTALATFGKKRLPEGGSIAERRHKRMMKNRESAARSRCRKQAYVTGLQLKINHLTKENDRLKAEHKQLLVLQAEPAYQLTGKRGLQRTKTAPF